MSPANNTYLISDWAVSASSPLKHHQVALCLLLAVGASSDAILELLPGLTPGQLNMLQGNKIITAKQTEFKERFLGDNADEQFQHHMPKAFEIMTEVLNADSSEMKLAQRFEAAKWLMEKVTGKARQALDIEGGITVLSLLNALDAMKAEVADSGEAVMLSGQGKQRDVTPKDPLAEWVALNVPKST